MPNLRRFAVLCVTCAIAWPVAFAPMSAAAAAGRPPSDATAHLAPPVAAPVAVSLSTSQLASVLASISVIGRRLAVAQADPSDPPGVATAVPTCNGKGATIVGTSANDVINGTGGDDVIVARGGADVIHGRGGNDTICGGPGADKIYGDAGDDLIDGGSGNDTMGGGPGADSLIFASSSHPVIVDLAAGHATGQGSDTLSSFNGVLGSPFGDTLTGSSRSEVFLGGDGNDTIHAKGGTDVVFGNGGNDLLDGGPGDLDTAAYLYAGPVVADLEAGTATGEGSDTFAGIEGLVGSASADDLKGDAKTNYFVGAGGNDILDPRGGLDVIGFMVSSSVNVDLSANTATGEGTDSVTHTEMVVGTSAADTLRGGAGDDVLFGKGGHDVLIGAGGDDRLYGGDGPDTLRGGPGDDTLSGDSSNDKLVGGGGTDAASYEYASHGVTVDLAAGTATGDGTDSLTSMEGAIGSSKADELSGTSAHNVLLGLGGADRLYGRGGADVLNGGSGDDRLYGNGGKDQLIGEGGTDTANGGSGTDVCVAEVTPTCEDPQPADLGSIAAPSFVVPPAGIASAGGDPVDTNPGDIGAVGIDPGGAYQTFTGGNWYNQDNPLTRCNADVYPAVLNTWAPVNVGRDTRFAQDQWLYYRSYLYNGSTALSGGESPLYAYQLIGGGTTSNNGWYQWTGSAWIGPFAYVPGTQYKVSFTGLFQVWGRLEWHTNDGSLLSTQWAQAWVNHGVVAGSYFSSCWSGSRYLAAYLGCYSSTVCGKINDPGLLWPFVGFGT